MARRFTTVFLGLTLLACGIRAKAQSSMPQPAEPPGTAIPLTLGHSMLPLYGPWKFQVGDSPLDPVTHQALWAQPEFDDATWETVNLTPGYVAGWGQKGHPGYSGYAWYRIRVRVNAPQGEKLDLAGPAFFDDAYQLFLNGTMVGCFGNFQGKRPAFYYSEPLIFPLPQAGPADATQLIAFRFWMSPASLLTEIGAGGFHLAPLVGTAGAVAGRASASLARRGA